MKKLLILSLMCAVLLSACSQTTASSSSVPSSSLSESSSVASRIPETASSTADTNLWDNYELTHEDRAVYDRVCGNKSNVVAQVQDIIAIYQSTETSNDPKQYPPYPLDFPATSKLPTVTVEDNFAVRITGDPKAAGSVYLAVPIAHDGIYELHIAFDLDEVANRRWSEGWNSVTVSFAKGADLKWHEQDIDLYNPTEEAPLVFTPKPGEDAYYLENVAAKQELTPFVAEMVASYKAGTQPDNTNHFKTYPTDFPPVQQIREVKSTDDFVIRFAGNPDAKGSVYIAVPIGSEGNYELHLITSESAESKDAPITRHISDAYFAKVADLSWHEQDDDLYEDAEETAK